MRRQCAKCPWKLGTDPRAIPRGYCETKHRALIGTIAEPGSFNFGGPLRVMACHDSPTEAPYPCIGWLDNQLNHGNNLALRLAVIHGRVDTDYELDGPQHRYFEGTLPKDEDT